MVEIFRFVGVCLITMLLMQTLKGISPTGALLLLLGAVLVLAVWGMNGLQNVLHWLRELAQRIGLSESLYLPIVKVVGIAATSRIAGAVCKDAGASALAAQLELACACAALLVCLPLFGQVLEIANALLD